MRPLRYSINVTVDGCCDHRAIPADEDLHRHAAENLDQADAVLFGRVTYEMMEAAWRPSARRERGLIGWNPSPARSTRPRSTSCRAPSYRAPLYHEQRRGTIGTGRIGMPQL